jgi:hypothetical protein
MLLDPAGNLSECAPGHPNETTRFKWSAGPNPVPDARMFYRVGFLHGVGNGRTAGC